MNEVMEETYNLPIGVVEVERTRAAEFFDAAVFVAEMLLSGVAAVAWRMWRAGRLD